jgi:hypothetical protein
MSRNQKREFPNWKKLFVSEFTESPGSKTQWLESGRFGKSGYR